MRTIKDPKRKPEVRRRTDYEEEEDCRSTKSTPPKKRKTSNSKASSNDSSSLNDSGSFADNQSDVLSERSREDDVSDISSLKSTPPKKRNYSKLLKQSAETNGEVHAKDDAKETKQDGKLKGSKRVDKKVEIENKTTNSGAAKESTNKKNSVEKKPVKGGKKKSIKEPAIEKPEKNHMKDNVQDIKKTPKGRKVKPSKQEDIKTVSPADKTPPKKKVVNRKRKLVDEDDETVKEISPKQSKNNAKEKNTIDNATEVSKTAEIQSKKLKKSKKQLKEEATLELKRQTEEQRNAHSILNKESETVSKKKKVSPKKKILKEIESVSNECKNESVKVQADTIAETVENKDKTETKTVDTELKAAEDVEKSKTVEDVQKSKTAEDVHKSKTETTILQNNTCKPLALNDTTLNNTFLYGDEEEDSSDLDTSFESINSVRYSGDRKDDNLDKPSLDDVDKLNESLGSKPGDTPDLNLSIKCDRCGYISRSKGGHTRHLRKCQPEQLGLDSESKNPKVHVCEKCEYNAPRRVLVINHMKIHGIYQCKRCQYRTDNEETLDQHSGQEHKDRSDCKFCKLCNRYVKCSDIPLEKHMEECQGRIPFKCPECFKEFQYESSLKCHVVSHYPDQPKLFSCDRCDYKSNYKANLKKHIRHIHEQRGEKTIKCPDCEKLFHTEDNMRRHQKLHSEERPHKCEQEGCDKAFKTLNGLKFHLVSHQTDRPFVCEVEGCNKGFKSKKSLAMHLNETHQNAPKNFHCSEEGCDMAFYKKCHFERHMAAHTDNRMHFCRWLTCTKAFRTAESLKTHMLVHTNEKPVKCEHCEYTCRQRNSIRFHMKKKHPELCPQDLTPLHEPSKQVSHVSDPTMTTSKVLNSGSAETNLAECVDNKENLVASVKMEPSSPISSQSTDLANRINYAKNKFPNRTKNSYSVSPSLDRYRNHTVQNHVSSNENKQNVPSNENKESTSVLTSPDPSHALIDDKSGKGSIGSETPVKKPKKTDMYEFMSEDESEDEMKPGLLRRDYDRDKPPLPPVTGTIDPSLLSDLNLPHLDNVKKPPEEKTQKSKKKPGPKPKAKAESKPEPKPDAKPEAEAEVKVPKKRGRKKKSETEKVESKESDSVETETVKPKRGRSPKAKKEINQKTKEVITKPIDNENDNYQKEEIPAKKKRGPKKKAKANEEKEPEKVTKKRGRKKKGKLEDKKEIEPENGDATINYSEVESDKMFADSKDGVSDQAEAPLSNIPMSSELKQLDSEEEVEKGLNTSTDKEENEDLITEKTDEIEENKDSIVENTEVKTDIETNDNDKEEQEESKEQEESENKVSENFHETNDTNENLSLSDKEEEKRYSGADSESSDIGSDFDEDLKPPPAPRPPPMYDSEDGDIESGPENEDCNGSLRSNERIRDFESSREISREISRDFESSREIDDSVKTYDVNSVETSTPKDAVDTPSSVNPYKNDSVGNDFDNQETPHPHSHHSSVPHTPSHGSIPPTPVANPEYESKNHPEETVIKSVNVQGQTNDENTDESSMPEVDKDYVGRFFEEIQCNPPEQISRIPNLDENSKSQDKVVESAQSDSGVPSSLTSNQTEASIQMQSPPTDLSHKRMDILPAERPPEEPFQTRPDSVHRIPERIPSVPTYEPQFNSIDPYASSSLPPRDTILRQTDQTKIPSPLNASSSTASSFMRFPDSEAMLQRQRMSTPYDRNIQNLHRITETAMPSHNNTTPLLRHVPGREDVFPGAAGVPGSMTRNPFHSSWPGQDVRPPHWSHPTYLQRPLDQQTGSTPSSLFGKDSYLPGREFMFDPTRAAAERNMFSSLASSHTQRPEIPHDTFQLERFDLGSYLSSHAYNAAPSLPVDYTRSAHSSAQKSLDERYRQSSTGVTDFRTLPQSSTASDMFGMNSSFNLDKFYPRESMYHSQHISENTNNPFLPGVPGQHSMFTREYTHRSFYTQNSAYPFVNMNDKNYSAAASAKHSTSAMGQQRELVPVPRPNMAHDPQLQDPYRHSSMLYNMMNRYFE